MKSEVKKVLSKFLILFFNNSVLFIFIFLIIIMGIMSDKFFTLRNWLNILNNFSVTAIVTFGVAVIIITGGIDISFTAILSSCAVLAAFLHPYGLWTPIIASISLGALLGLFNGVLVSKVKVNPFILSLGSLWLFRSVLFIITKGNLVQGNTEIPFDFIGHGKVFNIPFPILVMSSVFLAIFYILRNTKLGKYIYAYGSNKEALYSSGVNVNNILLGAYVLMGITSGIGGVVFSSMLTGVRPIAGDGYLIVVLTAIMLGGVSLAGGHGSLFNVLIGVLLLGVISNGMVLLSVKYSNQQVIKGFIFILAIIYINFITKKQDALAR